MTYIQQAHLSSAQSIQLTNERLFDQIYQQPFYQTLWALLTKSTVELVVLDEIVEDIDDCYVVSHRLEEVSLNQVKGCCLSSKTKGFDHCFRPLQQRSRERWVGIANARCAGKKLPPVRLIKYEGLEDDVYFVEDGHHRLSVARALGDMVISAEVIVLARPVVVDSDTFHATEQHQLLTEGVN